MTFLLLAITLDVDIGVAAVGLLARAGTACLRTAIAIGLEIRGIFLTGVRVFAICLSGILSSLSESDEDVADVGNEAETALDKLEDADLHAAAKVANPLDSGTVDGSVGVGVGGRVWVGVCVCICGGACLVRVCVCVRESECDSVSE